MKQVVLSLCTLSALLALNKTSSAQQREVDLQLILDAPTDKSTYQMTEPIPFTVSVKNNGPDNLVPGDTLFLLLPDNSVQLIFLAESIDNEETAEIVSTQFNLLVNTTTTVDVCVLLFDDPSQQIELGGLPAAISYTDPDSTNNMTCNEITIESEPTSIATLEQVSDALSLYPNPASSLVRVPLSKMPAGTFNITVRDIAGKIQVMPSTYDVNLPDSEQYAELDVSHLSEGLYLIELSHDKNRQIGKLVIAR